MPAKFHEIPSMGLQDIKETKRYGRTHGRTHGRTDGQRENSIPPLKLRFGGGYNNKGKRYTTVNTMFTIIKVGLKEVYIIQTFLMLRLNLNHLFASKVALPQTTDACQTNMAAPVAERLRALFLNHSIISLLCLVWV